MTSTRPTAELIARGHEVKDWPDWTWLAGGVEAVRGDPAPDLVAARAGPRRPAYAIAA
jgi:gamma-glutamyltranspeptidase/glutathione hydrolase